jgi:hypothetical protein
MAESLAPRLAMLALLCAAQLSGAAADSTTHPLQASELLGLVAGNTLPENVAREIAIDGLAFRPDEHYRPAFTQSPDECLYRTDNVGMVPPRSALCAVYDRSEQASKSVKCNRRLLAVLEKQFGASSPQLVTTLASQVKALRKLGQATEADKIDQRMAQIRATTLAQSEGVQTGSRNPN